MNNEFKNIEIYNNQGDLLGLEKNGKAIMYHLEKKDPLTRKRIINRLTAVNSSSKGSKEEMETHFASLPKHIRQALIDGELRLADTIVYSVKPIVSKTIKMFETQDDKGIGLRNISNAKLPKNQALLVSGIIIMVGTAGGETKDDWMSTSFDVIDKVPALNNGEFSLKSNKKQIVPETSNMVFNSRGHSSVQVGYYKLDNPRLIEDDVLIELTIELGTMKNIPKNAVIYAGLHGTITTP
jgi:hypothetical protein